MVAGAWLIRLEEAKAMGFWAFNVDTMFWALVLGIAFLLPVQKRGQKSQLRRTDAIPVGY